MINDANAALYKAPVTTSANRRQGLAKESVTEISEYSFDQYFKASEGLSYHLVCRWLAFGESHFSKEAVFHIRVGFLNSGEFCICLYTPLVNRPSGCEGNGMREQSTVGPGQRYIGVPVLVDVAESFEPGSPQAEIMLGLKAGLVFLDECYCLAIHPRCFVLPPPVPVGGMVGDWESCSHVRLVAVDDHELPSEMIESRAKVVNSLSHSDRYAEGRRAGRIVQIPDLVSGLRLSLRMDGIWPGLHESLNESVRLCSVVDCPRELSEGTVEAMHDAYLPYGQEQTYAFRKPCICLANTERQTPPISRFTRDQTPSGLRSHTTNASPISSTTVLLLRGLNTFRFWSGVNVCPIPTNGRSACWHVGLTGA